MINLRLANTAAPPPPPDADRNVLVCLTHAESPIPNCNGSTADRCADCDAPIWVAPTGRKFIAVLLAVPVCMACLEKSHPDAAPQPPSAEQLAEMAAALTPEGN